MDRPVTTPSLDQLLDISSEEITTLIDRGVVIEGVLRVTNGRSILVSGEVHGSIVSNGAVVINQDAAVIGSIQAKSLQVGGKITGKDSDLLDIAGPIVLTKTAILGVNAVSDGVQTEYGAVVNGHFRPRADKGQRSESGADREIPSILRKDAGAGVVLQAVGQRARTESPAALDQHVG
ncbi:MAG TPA: polymer-forming cytoskeletal protein [Xanthomonadales bacterium]|nr:polymer-forming cytoskeletal protein [Xanthomonadales bacterium]